VLSERVEFYSEGELLAGYLRLPNASAEGGYPVIVHGPGWLGLAGAKTYEPWHEAFTAAGYAVLAFDYRGFGDSSGDKGWVNPFAQIQDIRNAVTFAGATERLDHRRIGIFGMGGTGGGNAIIAAATDTRISCVCVQTVVADGADWLHRMRREYEWVAFKERLALDRAMWVRENTGAIVDPREELMVATPERRERSPKKEVDKLVGSEFYLKSADYLLQYRPIDYVARVSPRALLVACVRDDVVTPEEHAVAIYERAGAPKRLIRQLDTSHYRSYVDNFAALAGQMVDWYDSHMLDVPIEVLSADV